MTGPEPAGETNRCVPARGCGDKESRRLHGRRHWLLLMCEKSSVPAEWTRISEERHTGTQQSCPPHRYPDSRRNADPVP